MQTVFVARPGEFADQFVAALQASGIGSPTVVAAAPDQVVLPADPPALTIVIWDRPEAESFELCRRIREKFGKQPLILIALTNDVLSEHYDRILAGEADDYIAIPCSERELDLRLRVTKRRIEDRLKWANLDQQLRASIERFELAVRGANEGLWDAQDIGRPWFLPESKVWYSSRFKELLGYESSEFPDQLSSWLTRLHPEDREQVLHALTEHFERRRPLDLEYRLLTRSGEYRWFSARGQSIWDEQGRAIRVAGSLRDITDTKKIEEKLRQSESRWRTLVENVPALIVVTTPEGIIQFVNRDSELANQSIGKSVYEFTEASYHEIVRETYQKVIATGEPQRYEVRGLAEGGAIVWYSSRLGPIVHDGKIESIVVIAIDITRRKNAEKLVREEREHLRRLLDLQERERQLVAYEIHDGLTQYLTGGIMHLESFAESKKAAQARKEYDRGMILLREALGEARRLISGLRPPVLDELGIVAALEYLVNESREAIPQIEFVSHVTFDRLAAPLEVAIFRVAQEALTNIRKHSDAKRRASN
jgi:PAS domain S-box-containing protein